MPPLAVTLKTHEEATAILRRAGVCRGTQLQVICQSGFCFIFVCFEVIALLYFGGWRLLCKGDGEYDASDEKGVGTTSPFPQPGDFHFEKLSRSCPGSNQVPRGGGSHSWKCSSC